MKLYRCTYSECKKVFTFCADESLQKVHIPCNKVFSIGWALLYKISVSGVIDGFGTPHRQHENGAHCYEKL